MKQFSVVLYNEVITGHLQCPLVDVPSPGNNTPSDQDPLVGEVGHFPLSHNLLAGKHESLKGVHHGNLNKKDHHHSWNTHHFINSELVCMYVRMHTILSVHTSVGTIVNSRQSAAIRFQQIRLINEFGRLIGYSFSKLVIVLTYGKCGKSKGFR